ncbi:HGxxPAAW family protein [Streptomyces sp. NPDC051041]|uniref:HGxxPAAW family protein n=1 Tax=Streptomyces sp. NPDC051041 TaxID=3365640 RepID=UPI0037BA0934
MSAHPYDHGHTVAGWTGFGIATAGAAAVGAGICAGSAALVAGGLGTGAVSLLVTWALHLAGWGKPPGRRPREQWGWRVRDLGARAGHPGCLGCRLAGRGVRRTARAGGDPGAVAAAREAAPAAAAADSAG